MGAYFAYMADWGLMTSQFTKSVGFGLPKVGEPNMHAEP